MISGPVRGAEGEALASWAARWAVELEEVRESPTSWLGFGSREGRPVVVKVSRPDGDEGASGAVAAAFEGRGMVQVLEHAPGAVLLERLVPGEPLSAVVLAGEDERATRILGRVARSLRRPGRAGGPFRRVEELMGGFDVYAESGDRQVPESLVDRGRGEFVRLCRTQGETGLLHGDLQHENVLRDRHRGWIAVDPKGLVGEAEYELGAALRNPVGMPELYSDPERVGERVRWLGEEAGTDPDRTLAWAYAQAVLSAIWVVEDHGVLGRDSPALALVEAAGQLLDVIP